MLRKLLGFQNLVLLHAIWFRVLSIVAISGITGCQLLHTLELQPTKATAQQLQSTSGAASLQGRVVSLQGTVVDVVPLAGGAVAYELRDETGSIWVLAKTKKIELGNDLNVQGKVRYQSTAQGEPNQGLMLYVEQEG